MKIQLESDQLKSDLSSAEKYQSSRISFFEDLETVKREEESKEERLRKKSRR